jgi:16S rRNA A1518/A1519 N6-dimethyltransferase RsmA/KsgA/DIM1 with predicted DNA glycosylase/AP lyase activity
MDKQTYKSLLVNWEKPVYQNIDKKKMDDTLEYIHLLQDRKVVDFGSNAGIITYDIAKYAKEFVGVEYDPHFYKQSLDTLKHIKTTGKFVNQSVGDFIKTTDFDYDAIFASCILYHLKTDEIDLIRDEMLPKCEIVLFISREDKKKKSNNPYDLGKWKNIRDFLLGAGMDVEVHNADSNWVSVIGRKK